MKKTNPNYLNGVPELLVLRLLSREEMYGYQLVKAIQERSDDALSFGEGCIYPILHSLVKARHLTSRTEKVNGRQRTYYRTTALGEKRLAALQEEWSHISKAVNLTLGAQHA